MLKKNKTINYQQMKIWKEGISRSNYRQKTIALVEKYRKGFNLAKV